MKYSLTTQIQRQITGKGDFEGFEVTVEIPGYSGLLRLVEITIVQLFSAFAPYSIQN